MFRKPARLDTIRSLHLLSVGRMPTANVAETSCRLPGKRPGYVQTKRDKQPSIWSMFDLLVLILLVRMGSCEFELGPHDYATLRLIDLRPLRAKQGMDTSHRSTVPRTEYPATKSQIILASCNNYLRFHVMESWWFNH